MLPFKTRGWCSGMKAGTTWLLRERLPVEDWAARRMGYATNTTNKSRKWNPGNARAKLLLFILFGVLGSPWQTKPNGKLMHSLANLGISKLF